MSEASTSTSNPMSTQNPDPLPTRLLIVDDDPDHRYLFERWLVQAGAAVTAVEDGHAALELVRTVDPDELPAGIVLDLKMPGVDGVATAKRLRESGFQGLIVALTARALESEKQRALAAGCDAFLTKPLWGPTLINALREQFEMRAGRWSPLSDGKAGNGEARRTSRPQ
jgi:CheY-like chemotaxis protein